VLATTADVYPMTFWLCKGNALEYTTRKGTPENCIISGRIIVQTCLGYLKSTIAGGWFGSFYIVL